MVVTKYVSKEPLQDEKLNSRKTELMVGKDKFSVFFIVVERHSVEMAKTVLGKIFCVLWNGPALWTLSHFKSGGCDEQSLHNHTVKY